MGKFVNAKIWEALELAGVSSCQYGDTQQHSRFDDGRSLEIGFSEVHDYSKGSEHESK